MRSAEEARVAVAGGAAIVDVKEPERGPLGMADPATWRAVVGAVSGRVPVSVALGELVERERDRASGAVEGVRWRKLGLAGQGSDPEWRRRWAAVRAWSGPEWIAVVYADATVAGAPRPEQIVDEAIAAGCAGVLFDTWNKAGRAILNAGAPWETMVRRLRIAGRLVVLAGGLDREAIRNLAGLRPDYFAVRGAACVGGNRGGAVDVERVRALVDAARG
ncbi:MAG: hypothetical protein KatS3mg108_0854 [Isosphaeraceae bacterium]|nr:MAG: hypothetical protein KatS3mg108_0854 [Isosphaeraceae bacterium]